jgi:hypothetical protein
MKRSPAIQSQAGHKKISAGIIDGYRVFDLDLYLPYPRNHLGFAPDHLSRRSSCRATTTSDLSGPLQAMATTFQAN